MSADVLADLGISAPVIAAPMAGGPTTPEFVIAAGMGGFLGFLAAGCLTAERLAADIATVRASGVPFGVNLFAPNPLPIDRGAYRSYASRLRAEADAYGVSLEIDTPREDDDEWRSKLELLLSLDDPVAIVSFTFGLPDRAEIAALRSAGTFVVQTVTSAAEAQAARDAGVDGLAVQASSAGGHWGTLTPTSPPPLMPLVDLVHSVRAAVDLPVFATGGIGTADAVRGVLDAGARAAVVGTVLLLSPEAGTSDAYRGALADPARTDTVQTRAFTGRPARGLRNTFIDRYDAGAPFGYPAVHHLTRPLRRAAAAAGNPELINLWAGTAHRLATPDPVAEILARLVR